MTHNINSETLAWAKILLEDDIQYFYDDPQSDGETPEQVKAFHDKLQRIAQDLDCDFQEIVNQVATPFEIARLMDLLDDAASSTQDQEEASQSSEQDQEIREEEKD